MALGASGKKAADTIKRLESLRKGVTEPLSFRMDPREKRALEKHADDKGLKPSQLVKAWVLERMRQEGLR